MADNHSEHTFAKLDAESEKDLVESLGIQHIPALLVYRDGILLLRQPGNFTEEQMEDIVCQAETVDMDRVRQELAVEAKKLAERAVDQAT